MYDTECKVSIPKINDTELRKYCSESDKHISQKYVYLGKSMPRRKLMSGRVHSREFETDIVTMASGEKRRLRFVASITAPRSSHAGEMSKISVEKRLFCQPVGPPTAEQKLPIRGFWGNCLGERVAKKSVWQAPLNTTCR